MSAGGAFAEDLYCGDVGCTPFWPDGREEARHRSGVYPPLVADGMIGSGLTLAGT